MSTCMRCVHNSVTCMCIILLQVMSSHYPLPLPPYSNDNSGSTSSGMFHLLSTGQLFVLLSCLEESHMFARSFNSNHVQRVMLMNAGTNIYCTYI